MNAASTRERNSGRLVGHRADGERWAHSIATALRALSAVDGVRAADIFWRDVASFRYLESDDWRLAGEDLRCALIEPLARDDELRRRMVSYFKSRVRAADLTDPEQLASIADMAEILTAVAHAQALADAPATQDVPPSGRIGVRSATDLVGRPGGR